MTTVKEMQHEKFAKLFDSEKYGQILVVNDRNDEGKPAVLVSAMPPNLGVCNITLVFEDDADGYTKCDTAFAKFDLEAAEDIAAELFGAASPFGSLQPE